MFTPEEIVRIAVQIETNGEKVYREALTYLDNEKLKSLLGWMADEEVQHKQWFENFLNRLEEESLPAAETLPQDLLESILGRRTFSLEETDLTKVRDLNELIRTSIEFEEDTVLFYEMLQSFIETESIVDALDEIISEERNHIRKLREFLGSST